MIADVTMILFQVTSNQMKYLSSVYFFIATVRCNAHIKNNHALVCRIADMTIS